MRPVVTATLVAARGLPAEIATRNAIITEVALGQLRAFANSRSRLQAAALVE